MKIIRTCSIGLVMGLVTLGQAQAANYCIAVSGGFGNGGTSFISKDFALPASGTCRAWHGFTRTASTVIAFSTGTGCLSNNGKVFTLSVLSTNPSWFGAGQTAADQIQYCPGTGSCPIGGGTDSGSFGPGPAAPQTCTSALLNLPALHD